ncbi:amidohydrolase [Streptomyces poriticola]|uniref:amidohydrolase n=1 Tax=Streptomyces poriticola TaxID=3120506 RepID=UPI002FCE568A
MTAASTSPDLAALYRDLHAHPELAFQETRTASIVAGRLRALGYETTTGVGGTGVVGLLRNGDGPTALLRADMDALPVREDTGLPYAGTAHGAGADGSPVPVMHACGHDVHVTCLLGAAAELAGDRSGWRGTVMLVFQPAEETGRGARAMVDDGLYERFGRPDVVLGQHVAPVPAGMPGLHPGPAFAASDTLHIVLHGRGGHGSRPETTVDPVVMAAAAVLRLQGVVAREVPGTSTAVLTVGALHAGSAANVIADRAELDVNVRTYEAAVRETVLAAVERIVLDPGPVTGSEDVGVLADAAGAPCVYWLLGGADPQVFDGAGDFAAVEHIARGLPSNHSPRFAPVVEPTLTTGVTALVRAAHTWLPAAP